MKTFNTSAELLASFTSGQGKTCDLPEIASLIDGKLTYDNYSVEITQVWADSYLLANLHRNLKDLPTTKQIELLNAYAENRLSLNHKFDAVPVTKAPVAGHYLSSDSLLNTYFTKVTDITIRSIYDSLSSINASHPKESILNEIKSALELIITTEQLEAVKTLEAKEKGLILGRNTLETIGCFDVTFISDKQLKASVPFTKVDTIGQTVTKELKHIPSLDKLGSGCLVMTFEVIGG